MSTGWAFIAAISRAEAGVVPKLSVTPGAIRHTGPDIGADTVDILRSVGLDEDRIRGLIESRIVAASAGPASK